MKIARRFIIAYLVVPLLIWLVGFVALRIGGGALHRAISERSTSLAAEVIESVDRHIFNWIDQFGALCHLRPVREAAERSNDDEFETLPDVQALINRRDIEWISAPPGEFTPVMREVIGHDLGQLFRDFMRHYEQTSGAPVFSEIFITNRYGATVAATGRLTDYRQDDETWWQEAAASGIHVSDLEYDESAGVFSLTIAVRIQNEEGDLVGVAKGVLDIREVRRIVTDITGRIGSTKTVRLVNLDGKVVVGSDPSMIMQDAFKDDSLFQRLKKSGGPGAITFKDPVRGDIFAAYARSHGHKDYQGSGWILLLEDEESAVMAPMRRLKKAIMAISLITALGAVGLGLLLARGILNPLAALREAARAVSQGNLDQRTAQGGNDEIAELSREFDYMTLALRHLTISRERLEEEVAERRRVEEALREHSERLETLRTVDEAILAARSPSEVARGVLSRIKKILPNRTIEVMSVKGSSPDYAKVEASVDVNGGASPAGTVVSVDRIFDGAPPREIYMVADKPGEEIRAPLWVGESLVGVMRIGPEANQPFSPEQLEAVQEIIEAFSLAIHQAQLREKIESYAAELEERVAQRTAELEAFSYAVCHDLRAPLRAVNGYAQALLEERRGSLDPETERLLKEIARNSDVMRSLMEALQALARLGSAEMRVASVDMEALARSVFEDLARDAPEKPRLKLAPLPPAQGDETMLREVFMNLLSNALKFARQSHPPVIEVGSQTSRREIIYYVRDNGVGFDMKYGDRLFRPFQRLHTAGQFEGTGAGLAIVKRIVQRHGGRVWADAKVNAGAMMFFTIPQGGQSHV